MSRKRLEQLFDVLGNTKDLRILSHNNPDPDAIASAVALRHLLADQLGVDAHIAYLGNIGRAENKTLVRLLDEPIHSIADLNLDDDFPVALVDTQPGAGNNALPAGSDVAIVIDHHPRLKATDLAGFADVRSDVGATSTILTEYYRAAGLEPTSLLATALFYGIKTDTRGLGRSNVCPDDVAAYLYLQPRLDVDILAEIEYAQVPIDYFRSFGAALQAVRTYNGVVIAYIGKTRYPDMTAETADFLLRLEGSQWVVCLGVYDDMLNLSIRTRQWRAEAGHLAQATVGEEGVAGGHDMMAGGQVVLRGQDPALVAQRLSRRALQFLNVASEVEGKPLI